MMKTNRKTATLSLENALQVILPGALLTLGLIAMSSKALAQSSPQSSAPTATNAATNPVASSAINTTQSDAQVHSLNLNLAANQDLKQPFPAPMSVTNSRLLHVTSASSKADLVKKFRALADRQSDELNNIDDRIKKYLKESTDVTLNTQDLKGANRKFKVLSDSLTSLNQAHLERKERQDLYNRFALAIDNQWNGQPLQTFLSGQCLDMAQLELTSEKGSSKAGVFLVYLSVAIREVVDRNEDVTNFIEDFTNYSSVLNPKSPVEFISSRSYTSGSMSYTANTIEPDKVSDLVSKKLDEIEKKNGKSKLTAGKKTSAEEGARELRLKNFEPDFTGVPAKKDADL